MATKNLARSAVEGGRKGRDMERWQTRAERQAVRIQLCGIRSVDDALDAGLLPPRWQDWDSGFTDKLNPTERFLRSRAGRPWNDVYSELCRRYDRRSLKGYHLVSAHIDRSMVGGHGHRWHWPFGASDYGPRVDEHGILRYTQKRRWW